jgi:hypothetical protein
MSYDREEVRRRLTGEESLEISTGGGSYEVWVEPYANPPAEFYEGKALPYAQLDEVIGNILDVLAQGQVQGRWVELRGLQSKACQEAHRQRATGSPTLPL